VRRDRGRRRKKRHIRRETDPGINAEIDTEYRTKYSGYSARYVNPMVAPEARATTMKHVPR
jgi:hypothetical protein